MPAVVLSVRLFSQKTAVCTNSSVCSSAVNPSTFLTSTLQLKQLHVWNGNLLHDPKRSMSVFSSMIPSAAASTPWGSVVITDKYALRELYMEKLFCMGVKLGLSHRRRNDDF